MNIPDPEPQVVLAVDIDLTSPGYYSARQVSDDLHEQAQYAPGGCEVVIRLGRAALSVLPLEFGRLVAGEFYLTADRITITVPGGTRAAAVITMSVARHLKLVREDHARMVAQRRASTG